MKKLFGLLKMLFGFYVLPPLIVAGGIGYLLGRLNVAEDLFVALVIAWPIYVRIQFNSTPLFNLLFPRTMNHLRSHYSWGRTEEESEAKGCILAPHSQMCITHRCTAWHTSPSSLNFFIYHYGACRIWPRGAMGVHGSGDFRRDMGGKR